MIARLKCFAVIITATLVLFGCGGDPVTHEVVGSPKKPSIVVIGDSLTAAYIPVDGVLQLRQDLSYTADIARAGNVITAAVGGATTAAALGNQVAWLRSVSADVVVILIGSNDAVLGLDRGQALSNVRAIAESWPQSKIVIVAPPPYNDSTDHWLLSWSAELRTLSASRDYQFVDLHSISRPDWFCHPTDRHPCAQAHREIGKATTDAVVRALTK